MLPHEVKLATGNHATTESNAITRPLERKEIYNYSFTKTCLEACFSGYHFHPIWYKYTFWIQKKTRFSWPFQWPSANRKDRILQNGVTSEICIHSQAGIYCSLNRLIIGQSGVYLRQTRLLIVFTMKYVKYVKVLLYLSNNLWDEQEQHMLAVCSKCRCLLS
jgi:hypothetical protein